MAVRKRAKSPQRKAAAPGFVQRRVVLPYNRTYVLIILILILIGVIAYYAKGFFIAAVVNGQPISRLAVINQLEQQNGKNTLDSLITRTLIEQEGRKKHVTVSDKEINDDILKIETTMKKQGQNFDDALAMRGYTRQSFKNEYKTQKLVEKLLAGDIKVSDKEVDAYIAQNKDALPQSSDSAQLRSSVKQQLQQQKLNQKAQSWIANLKNKAKINYFVSY